MDAEVKAYIDTLFAEYKATEKGTGNKGFKPTIEKWFRDENGHVYHSKMSEAMNLNGPDAWGVWERLRPIVTKMCGATSVKRIEDNEKANRYADAICQCIYDLLMEDK